MDILNFKPEQVQQLVDTYLIPWSINIALAFLVFIVGRVVSKLLLALLRRVLQRSEMDDMLVQFVSSIANALLFLVVIVAALDQLGVDTTSLVAVMGAAGLAIGLSLKDSLSNFAAGVMLLVFRPIDNGDFVEAAGISGIVESIGIFTTTLRTPDNKEVIVPNSAIYQDSITNYSARDTRRVDMVFGIGYDDDIDEARAILEAILAEDKRVLETPASVVALNELADSSVNFIVRPWVKSTDYWDVKFHVTEQVKKRFDAKGIGIPYPQMDLHINKVA
jgi:small conductance mechanosensitive channel